VSTGVNVAGFLSGELGLGELGRLIAEATEVSGLPYSTWTYRRTSSRQEADFVERPGEVHPFTVAAIHASSFPEWAAANPQLVDGRYVAGVWPWEVSRFRPYPKAFGLVDEVWAISEHNRAAVAERTDKPVVVIPLPTRVPARADAPSAAEVVPGLAPGRPYFFFAYDHLSVFDRKNPLGLVAAFTRAFPHGDGPALVIKAINGHVRPQEGERLREAIGTRDDVHLLEAYLTAAALGGLMDECLAYVSLHRSEGYGFTLAEAMVRGRPVVATAYSGNLDFMDEETAALVPWTPRRVGKWHDPYPAGATWADPDLDVAAMHLRWVVEHPELAQAMGERARAFHLTHRSIERTAAFVRERVERATGGGSRGVRS
jgi:glycosyltransferase involved in cell wall biosynthesis